MDNLPAVVSPPSTDLISEWLGGTAANAGYLRTSLDLSNRRDLVIATRFSGESAHANDKIDGKEFVIVAYAIKAVYENDPEDGEVKIYPRCMIAVKDGTHLVFCGKVALESLLLIAAGCSKDEWEKGIHIRVRTFKNNFKTISHRLELVS